MEVAELADVALCLDISGFFAESHLADKLSVAIPRTVLVQLSDTVYGEIGRAVPGDGDIPLEQLIGWMLDAGYAGPFDIELNGRRIDTGVRVRRRCARPRCSPTSSTGWVPDRTCRAPSFARSHSLPSVRPHGGRARPGPVHADQGPHEGTAAMMHHTDLTRADAETAEAS